MSSPGPWVDMHILLSERRDELRSVLGSEKDPREKARIEGAIREITWLLEQLQEHWAEWAAASEKT